MKNLTIAIIALAFIVMYASCKKDKKTTGVTLKASIEQNKFERTSLHFNGQTAEIHWMADDKFLVNNGTQSVVFSLTEGADTKDGVFTYNDDYNFGDNNVAVYPGSAIIDGNTVRLILPETQTLKSAGTFGNGVNPMLGAFIGPNNLTFTSLCGVLGLSLKGDNIAITGLEVVSMKDEKLNGLFECTTDNPVLTASVSNRGTNRVMLNCATTLTATETQEFYFVLPVGTLAEGFKINVYYDDPELFSRSIQSTAFVMELNTMKMMDTMEVTIPYVDLGLPSGLLWARCNVGANTPEGYGDYFAWGEVRPKDYSYEWDTYQHCNGRPRTLIKYCTNPSFGNAGYADYLTILLPKDDVAAANWGNGWRMPTKEEWQELLNYTTHIWTTQNGVNGSLFTASNGYSLFLPAAGGRGADNLYGAGNDGYYWSSSLYTLNPSSAWKYFFYSNGSDMAIDVRYSGFTVRPVRVRNKV